MPSTSSQMIPNSSQLEFSGNGKIFTNANLFVTIVCIRHMNVRHKWFIFRRNYYCPVSGSLSQKLYLSSQFHASGTGIFAVNDFLFITITVIRFGTLIFVTNNWGGIKYDKTGKVTEYYIILTNISIVFYSTTYTSNSDWYCSPDKLIYIEIHNLPNLSTTS